jgi:hypothetical protein
MKKNPLYYLFYIQTHSKLEYSETDYSENQHLTLYFKDHRKTCSCNHSSTLPDYVVKDVVLFFKEHQIGFESVKKGQLLLKYQSIMATNM